MIRVVVSGSGNMGAQVLATLEAADDLEPVGVIEPLASGAGEHLAASGAVYPLETDPAALLEKLSPDAVVDFTNAAFTPALTEACLAYGVRPVIGTSGQPDEFVAKLREQLAERSLGGVIAPNFALGAVVLMHLARIAAPHFDAVEVIELHHDGKVDSPSGTAVATAQTAARSARPRLLAPHVRPRGVAGRARGGAWRGRAALGTAAGPGRAPGGDLRRRGPDADAAARLDGPRFFYARRAARGA